jgi:alginate O-acetyltransferase complex protein AlgI
LQHAFLFVRNIFSLSLFKIPYFSGIGLAKPLFVFLIFFIVVEWLQREHQYALEYLGLNWKKTNRWLFYFFIAITTFYFSIAGSTQQFIYFQF